MSEKKDLDREDEKDEGEAAEEALKKDTPFNTVMNHAPLVLGLLSITALICTKYYEEHMGDGNQVARDEANLVDHERSRDVGRINTILSEVRSFDVCRDEYRPSEACIGKLEEGYDNRSASCLNLDRDSELLSCCNEFSQQLRRCVKDIGTGL